MRGLVLSIVLMFTVLSCSEECKRSEFPIDNIGRGCGNLFLYEQVEVESNPNSYVIIDANRENLELSDGFSSFDVVSNSDIDVRLELLNGEGNNYCTDALLGDLSVLGTYRLTEGAVEIRMVRKPTECDETYVIDANLIGAKFINDNGQFFNIDRQEFRNVYVNYIIG